MKKSGKNLQKKIDCEYGDYSKVKSFAKKHSSRKLRRKLNDKKSFE
jgi:menaquinone-dependent protoporphyrinogen IX oxidase